MDGSTLHPEFGRSAITRERWLIAAGSMLVLGSLFMPLMFVKSIVEESVVTGMSVLTDLGVELGLDVLVLILVTVGILYLAWSWMSPGRLLIPGSALLAVSIGAFVAAVTSAAPPGTQREPGWGWLPLITGACMLVAAALYDRQDHPRGWGDRR